MSGGFFCGKSGGSNILHLTSSPRAASDQGARGDSIFHSSLPHIFIVEEVAASQVGLYGGTYDVFQFPDGLIPSWEQNGYVYLLKVTYSNGRTRLLGGASAIQDGSLIRVPVSEGYFKGSLSYFQQSSLDTYQQVMWMSSASSNLDQLAGMRTTSTYQFAAVATLPLGSGDPIPECMNRFQQISSQTFQTNFGQYQKKYIAIGRSRYWPQFTEQVPTSNYSTIISQGGTQGYHQSLLSPFSYAGTNMVSRSSNAQVVQVSQLRINMSYTGGSFQQQAINNSGGEIKISNTDFTIGGLNLRSTSYKLLTQYTQNNPQYLTNYQGGALYAWDSQESYLNYGFNSYSFPQNSSVMIDQRTPSISLNGVDIWSPSNTPLRFLEQYTINVPQSNRQVSDSVQYITTLGTGGSGGNMQLLIRYSSSTKNTFYPGQYHQINSSIFYVSPPDNGGVAVPQSFTLINLPVGQYVPVHFVCGGLHQGNNPYTYTLWLHNLGDSTIQVYSTISFPSSIPRDGRTVPSPGIQLQFARLL